MFKDEKSREVQVIRKFRNRRMTKSFTGIVLVYLYYANTEELTNILSANPELANSAAVLIRELVPDTALSLENSSNITLTQRQYHEIVNILSAIRVEASPKLKNTIAYTLKKLETGEIFKILRISIDEN
jgi:3-methyladenine DNA glycosylase Mpg